MELLKERGIEDILVLGGGIIPDEDIPKLKEVGIAEIFGPGTNTQDVVNFIKEHVEKKRRQMSSA